MLHACAGGNTQPSRVLVSGHSLGGGVALIAGAWAALQWPAADVQVVTLGSPMPGNAQFAEVRAQPCRLSPGFVVVLVQRLLAACSRQAQKAEQGVP